MSRPPATTRESILTAATTLFHDRGYARTTVRDIASAAGVDPALVIRHFGSKEALFLQTMHLSIDDEPLLDVPVEQLGERLVEVLLDAADPVRGVFLALLRGSNEAPIAERLRDNHDTAFVEPLLARLSGPDAEIRARAAAAVVGGLLYALWVVEDPGLLRAGRRDLITRYGALLQNLFTPATVPEADTGS